jgi:hypothetical protein
MYEIHCSKWSKIKTIYRMNARIAILERGPGVHTIVRYNAMHRIRCYTGVTPEAMSHRRGVNPVSETCRIYVWISRVQ